MIAHPDGLIGLPLRLLAREVYQKLVTRKGAAMVALVTGEEKIIPPEAQYYVATAEAMPKERAFSCMVIDEIQLAADPARGHIFTDRILNFRGRHETLLLGAETMRPLLKKLIPGVEIETRERFSKLSYAGPSKLTKLPRRSAIVAFSGDQVYALAETLRHHKGGAALCMGNLSPKTRNAQIELYQSGETDFLVATDAIGMGVNMQVDHIAFAGRSKFDGRRRRPLFPDEIGQIAGRAGRFRNDGSFGETGDCPIFEPELVSRIEAHHYPAFTKIYWRNEDVDLSSIENLRASLAEKPPLEELTPAHHCIDEQVLEIFLKTKKWRIICGEAALVERLWNLCQTRDFRKLTLDHHINFLQRLAEFLLVGKGKIPNDWLAQQISRLHSDQGSIDTVSARLAYIRSWRYITHKRDWVEKADHWQEVSREVEEKLSDCLHQRLTEKFVDRRSFQLQRRLINKQKMSARIDESGQVFIEDLYLGEIAGLLFEPDPNVLHKQEYRLLSHAARSALAMEFDRRAKKLIEGDDTSFALDEAGGISWRNKKVARLGRSDDTLRPKLILSIAPDQLSAEARRQILNRLRRWLESQIDQKLSALKKYQYLSQQKSVGPSERGLAFHLVENYGALERAPIRNLLTELDQKQRQLFRQAGLRFGEYAIFHLTYSARARRSCFISCIIPRPDCGLNGNGAPRTANPISKFLRQCRWIVCMSGAIDNGAPEQSAMIFWNAWQSRYAPPHPKKTGIFSLLPRTCLLCLDVPSKSYIRSSKRLVIVKFKPPNLTPIRAQTKIIKFLKIMALKICLLRH